MANPQRNNEVAARALVDAALTSDRTACAKHGVTDRTLRRWRAALSTDPQLSALFTEEYRRATSREWATELNEALNAGIQKLKELVNGVQDSTSENIDAVTAAVLGMAETVMTRDMIAAQLSAAAPQPSAPPVQPAPAHSASN